MIKATRRTRMVIGQAFLALRKNIRRTALTMLGIVVGVAVLVLVLALGDGLEQIVLNQLGMLNPKSIFVEIKVPDDVRAGNGISALSIETLTLDDMDAILELPNVEAASAWYTGQAAMTYDGVKKTVNAQGANASYPIVQDLPIAEGRFFTEDEDASLRNVIVLGSALAEDLLPRGQQTLVGERVRYAGKGFTVVGVLDEQGTSFGFSPDDLAYIPINTGMKTIWGVNHIQAMMIRAKDIDQIKTTAWRIRSVLRRQHDIEDESKEDFRVGTFDEVMGIVSDITAGLTLLLGALAGISLVVGGVGIMNVLYASVTERRAEIGLRKALGARPFAILLQFLVEAMLLTGLGGLVGVALGVGLAWLINFGAAFAGFAWDFSFPLQASLFGIMVAVGLGLLFGYAPARMAVGLNVVETLKK